MAAVFICCLVEKNNLFTETLSEYTLEHYKFSTVVVLLNNV